MIEALSLLQSSQWRCRHRIIDLVREAAVDDLAIVLEIPPPAICNWNASSMTDLTDVADLINVGRAMPLADAALAAPARLLTSTGSVYICAPTSRKDR